MPIVDIKGVGQAQFPDEMPISDIRNFLRKKYSQQAINGQSDILAPAPQTIEAYEPTLSERMGQSVSDALYNTGIVSDRYGAQRIGSNVAALGEMLPGVGDAAAGDDAGRAFAKGDYAEGLLHSAGAIPVLGDMAIFAGALAKNADLGALRKAKLLEDTGADRNKIWKDTGWFNDRGDWKFEISDALDFDTGKGADINPSSFGLIKEYGGTTKENFMGHPDLYEAYPNLKDRPIKGEAGSGGKYVSNTDTTFIGENLLSPDSAKGLDEAQSVGLHEIQHAIQNREGFAKGGSPKNFKGDFSNVDAKQLADLFSDASLLRKVSGSLGDIEKGKKRFRMLMDREPSKDVINLSSKGDANWLGERANIYKSGGNVEAYRRLAGEVEARNVQTRMNMTPEERRAKPPWETFDVPESELIYRKGSGVNQSLPMGKAKDLLKSKYPDLKIGISETKDNIILDKVVVSDKSKGTGTKFMNDLISDADSKGKAIGLTPSADFGGNKKRLTEFYSRFGFVPNKGKNKDYTISETMIRLPIR